jgi:hypothetical protein
MGLDISIVYELIGYSDEDRGTLYHLFRSETALCGFQLNKKRAHDFDSFPHYRLKEDPWPRVCWNCLWKAYRAKGHSRKGAKQFASTYKASQARYRPPKPPKLVRPVSSGFRIEDCGNVDFVISNDFLRSYEWRKVRYEALKNNNGTCELCGRGKPHGVLLHVDHIKPRRTHPHLALELSNLQVLCEECNHGKGNWDDTDWRSHMGSIRREEGGF